MKRRGYQFHLKGTKRNKTIHTTVYGQFGISNFKHNLEFLIAVNFVCFFNKKFPLLRGLQTNDVWSRTLMTATVVYTSYKSIIEIVIL